MFNIIETPRNYVTRELLHNNFSSNVAVHFNISHWPPYSVVSCSEEVFCRPSTAPVVPTLPPIVIQGLLLEGLQTANKTKSHPKAKLQNVPTFTGNRRHSHVCFLLVIKIKTCT